MDKAIGLDLSIRGDPFIWPHKGSGHQKSLTEKGAVYEQLLEE